MPFANGSEHLKPKLLFITIFTPEVRAPHRPHNLLFHLDSSLHLHVGTFLVLLPFRQPDFAAHYWALRPLALLKRKLVCLLYEALLFYMFHQTDPALRFGSPPTSFPFHVPQPTLSHEGACIKAQKLSSSLVVIRHPPSLHIFCLRQWLIQLETFTICSRILCGSNLGANVALQFAVALVHAGPSSPNQFIPNFCVESTTPHFAPRCPSFVLTDNPAPEF